MQNFRYPVHIVFIGGTNRGRGNLYLSLHIFIPLKILLKVHKYSKPGKSLDLVRAKTSSFLQLNLMIDGRALT
jgi:hypothetical protein